MAEPATQPAASPLDLSAYCRRIGFAGELKPDFETLRALHIAHVGSIPFENVDVLLERPILLDTASLQQKLVVNKRGGYCFEQNCFFKDVLEAIGFRVIGVGARVRFGTTGIRPRTHMALLVETEGRRYLADTGFGAQGLLEPIPLESDNVAELPIVSFRVKQEKDLWVLQATWEGAWSDLYAFTLEPQERVDYVVANHFVATYPESIFRQMVTAQIVRRHERKMLRHGQFRILTADGEQARPVTTEVETRAVLAEHFGIQLSSGSVLPARIFS